MFETNDIIRDYINELLCWICFEKTYFVPDTYAIEAMTKEILLLEEVFF